ncbi:MAG TPA: inositol monophosphatase family protein [Candidatus Acidoferrales bacterium]|jgi:myo-inositol-1(or 4)-monophosphatase|nr:inositol monophosphatase family protein [Candidatus Acidoferrales bacterium]
MDLIAAQKAAVVAARAAGKLMRDNWNAPKRVNELHAHDIKLELDVRCQKTIEAILRRTFPGIPLLGEEGCSGDVNAEYRWVVDPIDGTVNFYFGMPHAAVSIALQRKKDVLPEIAPPSSHQSLIGVIYDPFTDELWTASRGGKTRLNGRVVTASRRAKVSDAVIAMGFSKSRENLEKSIPHLNRIARRAKKIRIMGSAALELAYVASGRLDAYIERTINIWDIAAGGLMVECSGGEMFLKELPDGRLRMCADNGQLRKKLNIGGLFK